MITDKVRPHHLERKALLYVRQAENAVLRADPRRLDSGALG